MFIFKSILLTALQITEPSENTKSNTVASELTANIEHQELQQNVPTYSDTYKNLTNERLEALEKKANQKNKLHLLLYGEGTHGLPQIGIGLRTYSPKNISLEGNLLLTPCPDVAFNVLPTQASFLVFINFDQLYFGGGIGAQLTLFSPKPFDTVIPVKIGFQHKLFFLDVGQTYNLSDFRLDGLLVGQPSIRCGFYF